MTQADPFRRVLNVLASLRLAVVVMVTLAVTCLSATIYESRHGTAAVQREVYTTGWFSAILVVLGINIFSVLMSRYPWKKHQVGFVMAHIGILTLLAGSLWSLHGGFDGNMALFEGDTTSEVRLLQKVVDVQPASGAMTRVPFDFEKSPPRPDRPRRFPIGEKGEATLVVEDFAPHVRLTEGFAETSSGAPALHFQLEAPFAKQDGWLGATDDEHSQVDFGPASFDFQSAHVAPATDAFAGKNHLTFFTRADGTLAYRLFAAKGGGREGSIAVGRPIETPWMGMTITVDKLMPHARVEHGVTPDTPPVKDERRLPAIKVRLEGKGGSSGSAWIPWTERRPLETPGGTGALVAYHPPQLDPPLPFQVTLLRFNSDKYPGTNNAATYESFVRVNDPEQGVSEHHISMNHPMHYRGYIFFQASFVEGQPMMSIFSVAKAPGLPLVYIGTTLISLGVVWMFYVKPYLARRQAAQALAAHLARQEGRHEDKAAAPASAPPAQPASGRA
jgi:ResB-like family